MEYFKIQETYLIVIHNKKFIGKQNILVSNSMEAASVIIDGTQNKFYIKKNHINGIKYLQVKNKRVVWDSYNENNKSNLIFKAYQVKGNTNNNIISFYKFKNGNNWIGTNDVILSLTSKETEAAKFYFIKN